MSMANFFRDDATGAGAKEAKNAIAKYNNLSTKNNWQVVDALFLLHAIREEGVHYYRAALVANDQVKTYQANCPTGYERAKDNYKKLNPEAAFPQPLDLVNFFAIDYKTQGYWKKRQHFYEGK